nr:hypothetical protein [Megavirus caiporensis]
MIFGYLLTSNYLVLNKSIFYLNVFRFFFDKWYNVVKINIIIRSTINVIDTHDITFDNIKQ